MTRDELDELLCETYPDQDGFTVSEVIDFALPLINAPGRVVNVERIEQHFHYPAPETPTWPPGTVIC